MSAQGWLCAPAPRKLVLRPRVRDVLGCEEVGTVDLLLLHLLVIDALPRAAYSSFWDLF